MRKKGIPCELFDISIYRNQLYGVAILWIMLFHGTSMYGVHYTLGLEALSPLQGIMEYGNMGCEIFLFCSGIFLYFSFAKEQDDIAFFKRRLLRLFLPVLVIDGWYWVLWYIIVQRNPARFFGKLSLMAFWASGDQAVWFVSMILVCYFLYPYLFRLFFPQNGSMRQTMMRFILLMAVVVALTLILRASYPEVYDRLEIAITRFPIFITGCLFGKVVYEKKKWPGWVYFLFLGIAVVEFYLLHLDVIHSVWHRWWYFFGGISLVFLIPLGLKLLHWKPLNKFLGFFGILSVNLYLSYGMLHHLCDDLLQIDIHRLRQTLLLLATSVVVAGAAELLIRCLKRWLCDERKKEMTA